MTIATRAAVAALASLLLAGTAYAQTAPAAKTDTKTETMAPTDKKDAKPHTPESIECSKEADAKGLKGKERKKFRTACKKEAADKMKK
jgi:invasion protein IalB